MKLVTTLRSWACLTVLQLKENDVEDDSEGEDLLGEDTPSEDTQSQASHPEPIRTPSSLREDTPPSAPVYDTPTVIPESPPPVPVPEPDPTPVTAPQPDPASTLRARHKAERSELLTSATTTTSISTSTTEVLLTHHRTEQEDLTKSLLDMARALKESSHAFNSTLEQEKNVLDSAAKGLDKNELGLEAATRKMGYLRTMTEGKGWLGRMMMYAWIAGLMVVAILVVFVLPKLRL
jgi:outer membrane biosynthesis protein TonB